MPEPELTLVLNSRLQLVGFTVGNDMSSRDIEGENPLYLPQAKVYNGSLRPGPVDHAGRRPCRRGDADRHRAVDLRRGQARASTAATSVGQMARTFEDLIGWLGRDNRFRTAPSC